jgi:hypothetical protein
VPSDGPESECKKTGRRAVCGAPDMLFALEHALFAWDKLGVVEIKRTAATYDTSLQIGSGSLHIAEIKQIVCNCGIK